VEEEDRFEPKPGDVLDGKFRIERVLGVGGMGVVAAAWHLELRTRVALKVLRTSASLDQAMVERFSREASAVSRLRSEYVVRVFDVGKLPDGGPPYIVMEHLEGEDLEARVATHGPMNVEEAVGYLLHACEGIAEAHSVGIVHRDLKPANLFLTRRVDGSKIVKVVDFGIAKSAGRASSARLTGPLVAMGSPQYMSPEQTRAARDVSSSTDIWSLGVCLYEMLTAIPPFDAPSVAEIMVMVLSSAPRPPQELRADIPPRLGEVVMRCLHKLPSERFRDVAALADALEEFAPEAQRGASARIGRVLGGPDGHAPLTLPAPIRVKTSPAKAHRLPRRVAVIGIALVGLLGVGAWRMTRSRTGDAIPAASAAPASSSASGEEPPSIAIQLASGRGPAAAASPSTAQRSATAPKKPRRDIGRTFPEPEPEPDTKPATKPEPAPEPTAASAAPPPAAPAPPPRFVVASARVGIGSALNTSGTTAANVNRTIGTLGDRFTACYRAALPQMPDPVAGAGMLHIETDEDGVITVARVGGSVTAPAACIAAAASGRKISNVDTGRARADIPLVFRAQ
jgi:eukaryotic-like serine/threonine-protein kinase